MSTGLDWLGQVIIPCSTLGVDTLWSPQCPALLTGSFSQLTAKYLANWECKWKPVSLPASVEHFALGKQTGSRRHLSLWCAPTPFSYNLNWHHLVLTLQQGLCGLNIMFIFPCTSSLEIDGFTPTWKLVGMETIQKMIRELGAFWNWAQCVLSHCLNETCLSWGLLAACFLVLTLSH